MLPLLWTILLLLPTAYGGGQKKSPSPGHWTLTLTHTSPHYFCPKNIRAGTPFLGLLSSLQLEDLFEYIGQPYVDAPQGEYVLETLTEKGFQILVHTGTGDRYKRYPPAWYRPGQYLDMQACGFVYKWGPLVLPPQPVASARTSASSVAGIDHGAVDGTSVAAEEEMVEEVDGTTEEDKEVDAADQEVVVEEIDAAAQEVMVEEVDAAAQEVVVEEVGDTVASPEEEMVVKIDGTIAVAEEQMVEEVDGTTEEDEEVDAAAQEVVVEEVDAAAQEVGVEEVGDTVASPEEEMVEKVDGTVAAAEEEGMVEKVEGEAAEEARGGKDMGLAPESEFSHFVVMREGKFLMSWKFDDEGITFRLEVETTGYVGLAFSPTGTVDDADVVVGWVDDYGLARIEDRHDGGLVLDDSQDLVAQMGYKNTTHTVVQFYRVWDTCDQDDLVLGADTVRVIGWYNDQTKSHLWSPQESISLYLQEPPQDPTPLGPHSVWEITAGNVSLPSDENSHYFCSIVTVPTAVLESKHHIIKLEPLIQPDNMEYVHDITLRECIAPPDSKASNEELFGDAVGKDGEECYGPDMPDQWNFCTIIAGVSVGTDGLKFPQHVGIPMGEQFGGTTYYRLQVHYNSLAGKTGIVDNSGLRVYYTDQPREMDVGLMDTGASINMLFMVPPMQNMFMTTSYCSADCTSQTIPEDGIKVWMGLLSTHSVGRKVRVRHVRDGVELPLMFQDNNYDYNFQGYRYPLAVPDIHHDEEVLVLPGDTLITECEYNTTDRNTPTHGGLGTIAEQCLAFLAYYPRMKLQSCRSSPTLATFINSLGVEKLSGDSEEMFEKLLSFTYHQTVGTRNRGNITEIVRNLATELELDYDELLEQLSQPSFFKDFKMQQDVLVKVLKKLKIEAPESFQGTIEKMFEGVDWSKVGPEMTKLAASGDHRMGCFPRDGTTQLIEYKPRKTESFSSLLEDDVCVKNPIDNL